MLRDLLEVYLLPALLAGYVVPVVCVMFNGSVRDLISTKHKHNHLHIVLWQFHTGLKVDPTRHKTHGDEAQLKRQSGSQSRATAEGAIVLFAKLQRWQRALRNNSCVLGTLLVIYGLVLAPEATMVVLTVLCVLGLGVLLYLHALNMRKKHAFRRPQIPAKPLSQSAPAKVIRLHGERVEPGAVNADAKVPSVEARPQLESGVPQSVVANLIAGSAGCSYAEVADGLTIMPERGEWRLPDSFAALGKQREPIQEIIEAHTVGKVSFRWETTVTPRALKWFPVKTALPAMVLFRDWLERLEGLKPGVFGDGVMANGEMYTADHNGDFPWHLAGMNSGTGKSSRFLVKGAQICHNDPTADLYCFDTKGISFKYLKGVPGVHIFDDPFTPEGKKEIWQGFYGLNKIMRKRYEMVRSGAKKLSDYNNIWVLVDEGNDLGGWLKSIWNNDMEQKGASPAIWGEAIGPLLRVGRQCNVRGEWMFQDITDKALGGESLKMAFSKFTMAGYLPTQFQRTIGSPAPPLQTGQGRALVIRGNEQEWIQCFYDDPEWLRAYALKNRKNRAAA